MKVCVKNVDTASNSDRKNYCEDFMNKHLTTPRKRNRLFKHLFVPLCRQGNLKQQSKCSLISFYFTVILSGLILKVKIIISMALMWCDLQMYVPTSFLEENWRMYCLFFGEQTWTAGVTIVWYKASAFSCWDNMKRLWARKLWSEF